MKYLIPVMIGWLVLPVHVQAASFDCAKASTKVEHIICDNPDISKLDDEMATSYKAVLQGKTQKEEIRQVQKEWMKERNNCGDTACVNRLYEARLHALGDVSVDVMQSESTQLTDKEKGEMVSKFLSASEVTLRPGSYDDDDLKFCTAFLEDFKRQRNIEYFTPQFRTSDYNHPELVKFRNQCPKTWAVPGKCDVQSLALWLKVYENSEEAAHAKAKEMCERLFGEEEFALYGINFGDHKEYVYYHSRKPKIEYAELERQLREPTREELLGDQGAWNLRTNTVINVFFAPSGFSAIDLAGCKENVIKYTYAFGVTSPESRQGFVKYDGHYLTYNLDRMSKHDKQFTLIVAGRNPVCHFDGVQKQSIKSRGSK